MPAEVDPLKTVGDFCAADVQELAAVKLPLDEEAEENALQLFTGLLLQIMRRLHIFRSWHIILRFGL
ncbi:MAG: hypothetical protein LBP22_05855 [Deltaproteobacteria bacterium]|nr:hypothetical protein [Deltaproteobacteria bacterium]